MNSLFSSTLDTVAPLRLRKIKEKSPTPWYNEHTRTLKRAARKKISPLTATFLAFVKLHFFILKIYLN